MSTRYDSENTPNEGDLIARHSRLSGRRTQLAYIGHPTSDIAAEIINDSLGPYKKWFFEEYSEGLRIPSHNILIEELTLEAIPARKANEIVKDVGSHILRAAEETPDSNPARFIFWYDVATGIISAAVTVDITINERRTHRIYPNVNIEDEILEKYIDELKRQHKEAGHLSFFGKHYVPEFVIEGAEFDRDVYNRVYKISKDPEEI